MKKNFLFTMLLVLSAFVLTAQSSMVGAGSNTSNFATVGIDDNYGWEGYSINYSRSMSEDQRIGAGWTYFDMGYTDGWTANVDYSHAFASWQDLNFYGNAEVIFGDFDQSKVFNTNLSINTSTPISIGEWTFSPNVGVVWSRQTTIFDEFDDNYVGNEAVFQYGVEVAVSGYFIGWQKSTIANDSWTAVRVGVTF